MKVFGIKVHNQLLNVANKVFVEISSLEEQKKKLQKLDHTGLGNDEQIRDIKTKISKERKRLRGYLRRHPEQLIPILYIISKAEMKGRELQQAGKGELSTSDAREVANARRIFALAPKKLQEFAKTMPDIQTSFHNKFYLSAKEFIKQAEQVGAKYFSLNR